MEIETETKIVTRNVSYLYNIPFTFAYILLMESNQRHGREMEI